VAEKRGGKRKWLFLTALTIPTWEAAARHVEDYSSGDDAGFLIYLIPTCVGIGYLLGAETKSFTEALRAVAAIALILTIAALFVPVGLLAAIAGATAVAGAVGWVRKKSS